MEMILNLYLRTKRAFKRHGHIPEQICFVLDPQQMLWGQREAESPPSSRKAVFCSFFSSPAMADLPSLKSLPLSGVELSESLVRLIHLSAGG